MTHERRICHVLTFAELESMMQGIENDPSIHIIEGYYTLSMCGTRDECYEEDEILGYLYHHLHRNFERAFPIYDAEIVYFIEYDPIAQGLPQLEKWEWIDSSTFYANFGHRIDDDGDEYELNGEYQTDTGRWIFEKLYEECRLYVHEESYRNAMREQMETILRKEGITV